MDRRITSAAIVWFSYTLGWYFSVLIHELMHALADTLLGVTVNGIYATFPTIFGWTWQLTLGKPLMCTVSFCLVEGSGFTSDYPLGASTLALILMNLAPYYGVTIIGGLALATRKNILMVFPLSMLIDQNVNPNNLLMQPDVTTSLALAPTFVPALIQTIQITSILISIPIVAILICRAGKGMWGMFHHAN